MQHVSGEYSVSGRRLQRMVNGFSVMAVALIVFVVVCLVVFVLIDQMTLTILSNNFALILGTLTSNLLLLRIQKIKSQIVIDQHKAVLYESALLLGYVTNNKQMQLSKSSEHTLEANQFLKALKKTELFVQPLHIEIDDYCEQKAATTMLKASSLQIMTHI